MSIADDLKKISALESQLGKLYAQAQIETKTDAIIRAAIDIYAPSKINHAWWAWGYYESDSPEPPFSVKSNICFDAVYGDIITYYISVCGDDHDVGWRILDEQSGDWDLNESFPLQWLDLPLDEVKQKIKDGHARVVAEVKTKKEAAKLATTQRKETKKKLKDQAAAKLTPEELVALMK